MLHALRGGIIAGHRHHGLLTLESLMYRGTDLLQALQGHSGGEDHGSPTWSRPASAAAAAPGSAAVPSGVPEGSHVARRVSGEIAERVLVELVVV